MSKGDYLKDKNLERKDKKLEKKDKKIDEMDKKINEINEKHTKMYNELLNKLFGTFWKNTNKNNSE